MKRDPYRGHLCSETFSCSACQLEQLTSQNDTLTTKVNDLTRQNSELRGERTALERDRKRLHRTNGVCIIAATASLVAVLGFVGYYPRHIERIYIERDIICEARWEEPRMDDTSDDESSGISDVEGQPDARSNLVEFPFVCTARRTPRAPLPVFTPATICTCALADDGAGGNAFTCIGTPWSPGFRCY